jgi:uncharacterized membrane protein YhaH (DUF805 family)
MGYKEENNDFFGWYGTINRKNYTINILILVTLFILLSVTNYQTFVQYTNFKFVQFILDLVIELFKFIILISALSIVYRRIADFTLNKSQKFKSIMQKLFGIIFVAPILYLYCLKDFLNFIPILTYILNIITIYVLLPICLLSTLVLCFIKEK